MVTLNLPYNTLRQCIKAYHENIKTTFSFTGYDIEKEKDIKANASILYYEKFKNSSIARLEKEARNNNNIKKFFELMKQGKKQDALNALFE